jgi:hypothetical protein
MIPRPSPEAMAQGRTFMRYVSRKDNAQSLRWTDISVIEMLFRSRTNPF